MQFVGLLMSIRRLMMSMRTSSAYPNGSSCYSGTYRDGKAVYFYDSSSDGRIYNGRFWFSRTVHDRPRHKVREDAHGLFGNGSKQGRWLFSHKTFGLRRSLTVDYVDGHRSGCYRYYSKCSNKLLGTQRGTMMLDVEMHNHSLVGTVRYLFNKESLAGQYDNEGRPDGDWTMDSTKTRSHKMLRETWEHGVCVSSCVYDVTTGDKVKGKGRLPDIVSGVIINECKPLEHIFRKGTR